MPSDATMKHFFLLLCVAASLCVANAGILDFISNFLGRTESGNAKAAGADLVTQAVEDALEEEDDMKYPVLSAEEFSLLIDTSKKALADRNVGDAMDSLMTALEADPFAHEPNLLLGMTLVNKMKRPDLAESFLYRAVTASQWKDAASVSNLALCLIRNRCVQCMRSAPVPSSLSLFSTRPCLAHLHTWLHAH